MQIRGSYDVSEISTLVGDGLLFLREAVPFEVKLTVIIILRPDSSAAFYYINLIFFILYHGGCTGSIALMGDLRDDFMEL